MKKSKKLTDKERLDWLETKCCWIGIRETMCGVKAEIACGNLYAKNVREAIDSAIKSARKSEG